MFPLTGQGLPGEQKHLPDWVDTDVHGTALLAPSIRALNWRRAMARKRIEVERRQVAKCGTVATDVELLLLAAVLEEIAAMRALPKTQAPAQARPPKRKRRCAT
jgi:hypothetical protein